MAMNFSLFAAAGVVCYFLYGVGRTMMETFGLSLKSFSAGVFMCSFLLAPAVLGLAIVLLKKNKGGVGSALLAIILGCLTGVLCSEIQIMCDELSFAAEAVAAEGGHFSRARQWPHGNSALLFSEDLGFWATD